MVFGRRTLEMLNQGWRPRSTPAHREDEFRPAHRKDDDAGVEASQKTLFGFGRPGLVQTCSTPGSEGLDRTNARRSALED